ncbi:MAG TPA: bifunctional hydroxymethylpyrimidine kinase/phosphomethylpyrimidine kinase [Xanthobacteraceae bacterium]|nr:bifunctional hydroxymethylpyrimidine kinase/phosphomethylpyrimidine kinase [Xanthobacteraceae bacterium]
MIPVAVTIAGSDSGGGAGIQADLKTFSALGIYGASVIAALTAQNTLGVSAIHDVPPDFISAQIDAVYSDLKVQATKIGMLSHPATVEAVAAGLDRHKVQNVVLDPVMVAASGAKLLAQDAQTSLVRELFPRALLVTPNLHEASVLLDAPVAKNESEMREQGERILALGANAVLIKGGHAEGPEAVDLLIDKNGVRRFTGKRHRTMNTHGTGCTLSSAVAAGLAQGMTLDQAVAEAKAYVGAAIAAADQLSVGHGHGPVHHFHELWK